MVIHSPGLMSAMERIAFVSALIVQLQTKHGLITTLIPRKNNATNNQVPDRTMKWKKPQAGFVKLNTDGCWKSMNLASGGGVIRDDKGDWIMGFSIKFAAKNPEAAELLAIREGLLMAKHCNFNKIELETDAEGLKKMIQLATMFPHHELGALLHDVTSLIKDTWTMEIIHAKREANGVAHCLAKYGLTMEEARFIHNVVPDCAKKPHLEDTAEAAAEHDNGDDAADNDNDSDVMVVELATNDNGASTSDAGAPLIDIN